ncbi:hypothetical protein ABES25_15610 [Bacillus gobiensis]|uniref:hypothetical protein n=1 Tax=Bacillus gobiensis TaxID=1441095 RepID=UPI003D23E55A
MKKEDPKDPNQLSNKGHSADSILTILLDLLKHRWASIVAVVAFAVVWPVNIKGMANILIIITFIYPVLGIFRGQLRKSGIIVFQTVAVICFLVVSLLILNVNEELARYLATFGMLAHGFWDYYHHRTDSKVVPKAYAEFCCILDVLLAIGILMPI